MVGCMDSLWWRVPFLCGPVVFWPMDGYFGNFFLLDAGQILFFWIEINYLGEMEKRKKVERNRRRYRSCWT